LNNQTFLSDYMDVIDLQHFRILCYVISNGVSERCEHLINVTLSYDSNYKCYTLMSQLSTDSYKSFNFSGYRNLLPISRMDSMFLHDSNQLPSYSTSQLLSVPIEITSSNILYEKFIFKRLPPPFNTNCQDYN